MTNKENNTTLIEYNREISPKIRKVLELKETLKEWISTQEDIAEYQEQIKEHQECIKGVIEDKNPDLVREIKDLETDIKLALKAAAKTTDYTPADLKGYMYARVKDSVQKTLDKAETFADLELEFI